ncbi:5-amino-6-(D-ribitylamino)uracil--L-tyrosine 4-hydroxyphenyl transferase CofH [Methanococcus maripaludis]|uniref:5-amino-6-(D-ribitylamino)uracil--L-tyrosine 4-hydroxyphenyl transferase n=2 Tax=Methanococcus maripaludis TaxID=39152 RepID=COFH_METM7|nr:5-amino-6-(D-ribitylamino)uracil--L-tyrosine 4-hydroxyphenyl transferase CofH [Methanococcus maripaludis]A6VI43.2 RecName: Full=5-amino-6-(D-ribitylamino)uracil--L-tyrosine 4-hydroxyphenyl transferase; AltName: Full=FO synthase subunit 2 [Methanococcus maripaludis C7]MBA2862614.1 FO synthase subunit 2 [Methanococcus maripaludis]
MDFISFKEKEISKKECLELFENTENFFDVIKLADSLRKDIVGDAVTYVVNANINFTNICTGTCGFCAYKAEHGDPHAFFLNPDEVAKKALEARKIGATEVCIQGGLLKEIDTYFQAEILKKVKEITAPYGKIDVHAFSPMEVKSAAENAGLNVKEALKILKESGLNSMPGTAAEILNDEIRSEICPTKLKTSEWIDVVSNAHKTGIKTTCTMMYGHVEENDHLAEHLSILRNIQKETGGFTEFVPLTFLHENAPLYHTERVKSGASGMLDLKVYAISRIFFKDSIKNIQTSWVKLGTKLSQVSLNCGANDIGGTLMEENISKSAGGSYGTYMSEEQLKDMVLAVGRIPKQRNTAYEIIE